MPITETICQVAIMLFTGSSIWAFAGRRYRMAFTLGLLSQPFWIYSTLKGGLWGMFAVSLWFTVNQIRGLINHRAV
ncbi:hypothetical protein [Geopsychrobacter electrodiphilus]|uniref:hypothetical protein n=1 Tax=Geopsychrobacter electrodiphilus TaxID=225196 RepID=UPI0003735E20|nr:hypothetical protein [Geopsychrobacter electrodiphilus]